MFPQQSVLEPSYLSITQVSAQELIPQQNDTEPSDTWIKQDQHHDQHQFMSYQGINSDTYSGDDSFFSEFCIEE